MIDGQKTLKELFTSCEFGSVTRSEYNDVATIVENENELQRKRDVERACNLYRKELEQVELIIKNINPKGLGLINIDKSVKKFKRAMEK